MKLRDELEEQVPGDGVSINLGFPSRPRTRTRRRRRRNISRVSRGMSSGVRSEGMPRSLSELMKMMDELDEQVPGDGVRWGVGITKHPHKPEKESKKEKRSKKRKSLDRPKSAEAKGEEMARHAAMCGTAASASPRIRWWTPDPRRTAWPCRRLRGGDVEVEPGAPGVPADQGGDGLHGDGDTSLDPGTHPRRVVRPEAQRRKKSPLSSRRTENSTPMSCSSIAPRDMRRSKRSSPTMRKRRRCRIDSVFHCRYL